MLEINISKEYTETPGGRYKEDGAFSGEEFRETMLVERYLAARDQKTKLKIILDGGYGYPSSFLEEAFGGLSRTYGKESVKETLIFVSEDEPGLTEFIEGYIENAAQE